MEEQKKQQEKASGGLKLTHDNSTPVAASPTTTPTKQPTQSKSPPVSPQNNTYNGVASVDVKEYLLKIEKFKKINQQLS